jgi:hypothetical protein
VPLFSFFVHRLTDPSTAEQYVHYIPVLPDLSDLEQKIEWAIANDEEARQIQANGQEYAKRILTDDQVRTEQNYLLNKLAILI